jgi:hypothetical protein
VLTVLAIVAAVGFGIFAAKAVADNLPVLKSWQRAEGMIVAMPAGDRVEVELGREPDARRVIAIPPRHQIGLSIFRKVPVYLDPADPQRVRLGGWAQIWLWPATLLLITAVLTAGGVAAARAGSTADVEDAGTASISDVVADIRLHPPASEWQAPLFWSLLGLAALASAIWAPGGGPFARLALGCAGGAFTLLMLGMSIESKTMEISAGESGVRKATALGLNQVSWDQVKGFELQRTSPITRKSGFYLNEDLPFPGRTTEAYAFLAANGRTLMRMSTRMEPAGAMRSLFDLCARKTGLQPQLKNYKIPDF